jgi:hypothetical protein
MKIYSTTEEHRLRLLRGAVTEYLDEDMVGELIDDLKTVLKEEEQDFLNKAKTYKKLYKILIEGKHGDK